jgi:uncharacterized protein YggU (UPF0235/DUF167 family)
VLEWILIIEGVVLAVLAVLGLIGIFIGKSNPDDPVYVFTSTFWREALWPPEVMAIDSTRTVVRDPDPMPSRGGADEEPSEDDAFYGRVRKGADGKNLKTDLVILVVPNAASDSVVGRDGDGLRLQVTGEAGESRSNKALIELVASAIGVKPYQVTLTKGHYQPRKTVQVQGLSQDELRAKLANLAEAD